MKKYFYCAKDRNGKDIKGTFLSESVDEAASFLRSQGYFVLELKEEKKGAYVSLKTGFLLNRRVTTDEIIGFCRQASIMIKSGITLKDAVDAISCQMKNSVFKSVLADISLQIQTGKTLFDSMMMHRKVFPQTLLTLVAVGEVSGSLDYVLDSAAEYLERDHLAKEKLKTSAAYPAILVTVFLITAGIMMTVVLPMFADLLKNLNVPLPVVTKVVLFTGEVIKKHGLLLILLIFLLIAAARILWRRKRCQYVIYGVIFKIPVLGRLISELTLLQFCNELAVMLASGVTIDKIIAVMISNPPNVRFEEVLQKAGNDIQKGQSLSSSLAKSKLFTPLFMQMLITGERSGNLARMMKDTAGFYQEDVDMLYKRIIAFAEPGMIIVISIFIGAFVAAVALPMFDAAGRVPM